MSELIIERLGAAVLRQVAEPVVQCDGELRDLVGRMFETMYAAHGQGLAAPQVGISRRIAVIDVPPSGPRLVLVNPRNTAVSSAGSRTLEGCLSIPDVWDWVERAAAVEAVPEASAHGGASESLKCAEREAGMSCQSLADVSSEGRVRVRSILFDAVRAECGQLGIRTGDDLRVLGHARMNGVLRTLDGRSLGCPMEFARFIEIETAQEEK